jgi:GTPase SAR1 family protein
MSEVEEGLSARLRRARQVLEPLRQRVPAAAGALDLLERDLLPRTAGGDVYLVAGIVGPNNSGKSALFNALAGREISPSVPAGGATRRLVGAAHPDLLARLRGEPTLARFPLRSFDESRAGPESALQPAENPAELLVAAECALPPGLMLIDTPDFDSILEDNRLASESLLAVADLVIAVVTRHSYQNREVVRFLRRWLDHGRPWMLVYNEAIDEEVAAGHAGKLEADVGTAPLAAFWAPHRLEVQQQRAPLEPRRLCSGAEEDARRLRDLLFDLDEIAEVKSRAYAAALARLRAALHEAAGEVSTEVARARAVLSRADRRAFDAGVAIASAAMPAGPFIEAFRNVIDRRSNPISRSWRATLRRLRLGVESLPRLLIGRRVPADGEQAQASLGSFERRELDKVWPAFWEELVRDLGREARVEERRRVGEPIAALLDRDLADERRGEARQRAEAALAAEPADVAAFRGACEDLVEHAIEERGFDIDVQAAADLATLMPLALAAVVIVHTGGLGSDIAVAGGGAVSTYLMDKYAHLLGSGIMAAARRRWTEVRGRQLAGVLVDAALPGAAARLRASVRDDAALAARLRELSGEVS